MQDGAASDPVVVTTDRYGTQTDIDTLDSTSLLWRVRGPDARMPYVVCQRREWGSELDVKITGTFGSVGLSSRMPLRVQQCVIGLVRWHSLSYGVGPDEARDAATLNRVTSESSRERNVSYDPSAISHGITGDPAIDRIMAEYTIHPGPWAVRGGDL